MEQLERTKGSCNILCNGPRIKHYKPNGLYTIGCNFPPVSVDATVIIDKQVIARWAHGDIKVLTSNLYMNHPAIETFKEYRKFFERHDPPVSLLGRFNVLRNYYSSGHWASYVAVKLGYTELNIYGCDSFWDIDIGSYTDTFIEKGKPTYNPKFVGEWRKSWHRLAQEEGKTCKFKFINRIEDDGTVIFDNIHYDRSFQRDP